MQTNSSPAYKGARFNSRGFCTSHSDVRLCRIASDGSFHIIRKTCFKCGSAGLAGHAKKTKLHGCKKKPLPHRQVQSKLLSADSSTRSRRSSSPIHKDGSRRRRRTLSPPVHKIYTQTIPGRPVSSSEVMKPKVTAEKISQLMKLMPPMYQSQASQSISTTKEKSQQQQNTLPRQSFTTTTKQELPFDKNGCCKAHPNVQLAKKNPDGGWTSVSGVCPQCCVSAVLDLANNQEQDSSKNEDLIGKVFTMSISENDSHQDTQPTSSTSNSGSYLSTPDSVPKPAFSTSYFTSTNSNILGLALDIQRGENMVKELNKSYLSERGHESETTLRHMNRAPDPPGCVK